MGRKHEAWKTSVSSYILTELHLFRYLFSSMAMYFDGMLVPVLVLARGGDSVWSKPFMLLLF